MTREAIEAAIPHRDPFLLIDEIVEQDERRIVCRKTFKEGEFWFAGHYPDFPITPGVLLCEAAMQAGAVLLSPFVAGADAGVPVATRMSDVRFKQMVRPGDTIEMEVTLAERLANAFFLDAKVTVGSKVAVRFSFACTMTSVETSPVQAAAQGE